MSVKVRLKRVGYYYQLPEADRLHLLRSLARSEPREDESAIVEYLDSGMLLAACPGIETDPLLPDGPFAGPLHVLTDGEYAWPKSLSYWVSRHHIRIPEEFLEHVREAGYRIPSDLDVAHLELV